MRPEIAKLKKAAQRDMSEKEILAMLEKVEAAEAKIKAKREKVIEWCKENDPFYAYVPTNGDVTDDRWQFLEKYLKPEDIPERLTSQTEAHKSTADIRLVSGGNRSGKSVFAAIEDYIFATNEIPPSMQSWYPKKKLSDKPHKKIRVIGVDGTQLFNTVIPAYQQWCPRQFLKKGSWAESWSAKDKLLTLYRGKQSIATLEFMTNEQDVEKFQGVALDKLSIDEQCDFDIWKENLMRFGTSDRLNVQMSWTPTQGMIPWVYDLTTDLTQDTELFKMASVVNPYVNLDVLGKILHQHRNNYNEIKMRLLGELVSLSGLVYGGTFVRSDHLIEPFSVICECKDMQHMIENNKCPKNHYIIYRGLDPHTVKPTACVWVAVNREGMKYVVQSYYGGHTFQDAKDDITNMSRGMRLGWSAIDKSADVDIRTGQSKPLNIYREITTGKNAIPCAKKSIKFTGSIMEGVNIIKQDLLNGKFYIMDDPSNFQLTKSFETMERDTYTNEDVKGVKDRIQEGPHDLHAALRYCFQWPMSWYPQIERVPEPEYADAGALY